MSDGSGPAGLREIDVTDKVLLELGIAPSPQTRRSMSFVKGPIYLEWLYRVDVARHTVVVALLLKMLLDTGLEEPLHVPPVIWRMWGIPKPVRKRAFDAMERAGIIRTERLPGKAVRIWLIDKP
jgi:hypothetical protein